MFLRFLAHEERRDRMSAHPRQLGNGARQRHGAHLEAADIIQRIVFQRFEGQFRQQRRPSGSIMVGFRLMKSLLRPEAR